MPEMRVKKIGYGSGKRKTGSSLPNLLRIVLGEDVLGKQENDTAIHKETIHVIKTNIDDMSPEVLGFLMETLFDHKALDVCFIPVQMKKNRPGLQVEVMCQKKDLEPIVHLILTQTSSIGLRTYVCDRFFLYREKVIIKTSFGDLQVKKIVNPDHSIRYVPEYDEVKKVAREKKIPLKDVYNRILCEANVLDRQ